MDLEFEYEYEEYYNPTVDGKSGVKTLIDYEVEIEPETKPYHISFTTANKDYTIVYPLISL